MQHACRREDLAPVMLSSQTASRSSLAQAAQALPRKKVCTIPSAHVVPAVPASLAHAARRHAAACQHVAPLLTISPTCCAGGSPAGSAQAAGSGGPEEEGREPDQAGTGEPDEAALEGACERMVVEAVRLLQEGQLEQAEYLISEGAYLA